MFGKRWIRHLIFWILCILTLTVYFMGSEYAKLFKTIGFLLSTAPSFITYSYLSLYVIVPSGIRSGKFLLFGIIFVCTSILFAFLYSLSVNYIYFQLISTSYFVPNKIPEFSEVAVDMVWLNIPFLMFSSAKVLRNYLIEVKKKNELESKNIEAELSLLSTQLHPHFLFNTLNNLYSLSLSGSPKTAISLQKIKRLMKYMLYECGQAEISLKKELSLIEDYLELEKLRYDKRLKVNFENQVENSDLMIAPMILFTFVENCFKHGSSKAAGSSYINISISTHGNQLLFKTENSIPDTIINPKSSHEGLGLENVKKRLAFLYTDRHSLAIIREGNRFSVELSIDDLKTED